MLGVILLPQALRACGGSETSDYVERQKRVVANSRGTGIVHIGH